MISDHLPTNESPLVNESTVIAAEGEAKKEFSDIIKENTDTVDHHNKTNANANSREVKYVDIYSLERGSVEDQHRFRLFFELLNRFADNVTESHLAIMKKRHPHIYRDDCQQLYAFNLDAETMESHNWIRMNSTVIKKAFTTNQVSQTFKTKWLTGNIIRHCLRWLNDHYHFQKPIIYRNIESRWRRQSGENKPTNVNFISF